MQCTSCKAELTPGTRTCPTCGAPTPYAEEAASRPYQAEQAPYSEQVSYIDKEAPGQGSQSAPQPIPSPNQADTLGAGQQPFMPQQPQYPVQPGYPAMGQSFPLQPIYGPQQPGYPPNPAYYQGAGQYFPQQPGYPLNPAYYQGAGQPSYPMGSPQGNMFSPGAPRQSHLARNLVIGIIGILIIGLLVGVGGLLFLQHQISSASSQAASKVVVSGPITASDPQTLYNQVVGRQPTVNDPLSAQDQTNWQALNQGAQESCTFNGGALHAKGPQGSLVGCLDTSDTYNNFAIQVQMTIIQGDAAGLTFRADPVGGKLYEFAITPQSAYLLLTNQSGTSASARFLTAGNSQAINTGYNKSNLITIIARDSSIYLYINKQYLTTINDSTSSAGMVGAIAITKSSPADVAFSNLKIWKL